MTQYVLRGGDEGAERLRLLARVKWPTTKGFLRRAGLSQGMRCLDVGCGIGAVTLEMARWVGRSGLAIGVDGNEAFIDLARKEARRRRLRVEFRTAEVGQLDAGANFDLVFARFLVTHLPDPAGGIGQMVRAARPGATVAVEDIDFPGHFSNPACPALVRYVELYQKVVQHNGGDAAIGPHLVGLLTDAGLDQVHMEVILPAFHEGEGKRVAAVTMAHIREAVVAAGLASSVEVDRLVAELEAFAGAPRTIISLPRIFQVWGRKP